VVTETERVGNLQLSPSMGSDQHQGGYIKGTAATNSGRKSEESCPPLLHSRKEKQQLLCALLLEPEASRPKQ